MSPPCKASNAGRDSDEDLQADTQARVADKHLSLAGLVQGYGIARFVPQSGTKLKRVSIRVSTLFVKIKRSKYILLFAVFYSYCRSRNSMLKGGLVGRL